MTAKKYKRGKKIESVDEFLDALLCTGRVMVRDRVYSTEWVESWTLRTAKKYVDGGHAYTVKRID